MLVRFNSRTREGATQGCLPVTADRPVSIHAPVKVRQVLVFICLRADGFNSRTREGAT